MFFALATLIARQLESAMNPIGRCVENKGTAVSSWVLAVHRLTAKFRSYVLAFDKDLKTLRSVQDLPANRTWQEQEAAWLTQRAIVRLTSVSEWRASIVATRTLIRTHKFTPANKTLTHLRGTQFENTGLSHYVCREVLVIVMLVSRR